MNAKMKVLSLALIGAFGYVGNAAAVCPAGPTTVDGGAWSSSAVLGTGSSLVIATPGYASTECRADSALGASTTAAATVTDDTPANEPSYRFQFLVNPDAFGSFAGTDSVVLFRANAAAPANGTVKMLTVYMVPGPAGAKRLRFVAQCNFGPSFVCGQSSSDDLPAGVNRIEGKLATGAGAAGQFDWWINAAAGTTEPASDGTLTALDNSAWVGVDKATMGLAAPTSAFAGSHAGQAAGFDQFDSRRSTYIGW